jgi:hypothetical protein
VRRDLSTRLALVRIQNTLKLDRMWVSEALLREVEKTERLHVVEGAQPMRFETGGFLP